MKKKHILVLFFLFLKQSIIIAQPILTYSDFAQSIYAYDVYTAGTNSGTTPGSSGPNQYWNYYNISYNPGFSTYTPLFPSDTPFYANFPNANFCYKRTYYNSTNPNTYLYSNLSSGNVEDLGYSTDIQITDDYTSDTFINLTFPLTYGLTINDTYDTNTTPYTTTYDAYGTLKTPFGTYTDVIRTKTVIGLNNIYKWYSINPYRILMFANYYQGQNGGYFLIYRVDPNLNISNNFKKNITLFPNPTNSILNIKLSENIIIDKVIVTDLIGKKILEETQHTSQVNVESLAKGTYLIQAYSGDKKLTSKFIKE